MAKKTNVIAAVLWMVGTLLSFSAMAVSIRELSKIGFSIFEILTVRASGMLVIVGMLLIVRPALRAHTRPQRMKLNLLRNTIHFVSQYAWATSLTMLPLAMVFALEFTMPAWTALLAVWLLHERMTPSRLGVVVLGLVGVLVILRPGIASFNPAAFLVLGAAVGYAITMITTKQLTNTESTFSIVFWMGVMQFPLAVAGSDLHRLPASRPWDMLPLLGVAICRNVGALLPEQRLPRRRCHPGGAARFHAHPADRGGGLGALRRAARPVRAARRAHHRLGRAVEPAGRKPARAPGRHRMIVREMRRFDPAESRVWFFRTARRGHPRPAII